jgi:hypothetical protein
MFYDNWRTLIGEKEKLKNKLKLQSRDQLLICPY